MNRDEMNDLVNDIIEGVKGSNDITELTDGASLECVYELASYNMDEDNMVYCLHELLSKLKG